MRPFILILALVLLGCQHSAPPPREPPSVSLTCDASITESECQGIKKWLDDFARALDREFAK
jgi:hypothetical protein